MKLITPAVLVKMGACGEAVAMARSKMPNGLPEDEFIEQVPRGDWLIWYLWHAKLATIEQVVLAGLTAGRRFLRFAGKYKAICERAFDAAEVVAMDNTPENHDAADAAYAAVCAAYAAACGADAADAAYAAACAADARSREYCACVDDIRRLMKTKKWKLIGRA